MAATRRRSTEPGFLDVFGGLLENLLSRFLQAYRDLAVLLRDPKVLVPLLAILAFAGASRLVRPDWYLQQQFHPDERWLFQTVAPLKWPELPGDATNDGAGLQYGSLPLYMVAFCRGTASLFNSNLPVYSAVIVIGRSLTGLIDLASVFLVFLLGCRLFDRRVGILAAFFLAMTPLHIQLSHFFTVDPFAAFFALLTLYAAARVAQTRETFWSLLSGLFLAMAIASKSSALPLALPVTLAHLWPCLDPELRGKGERQERVIAMAWGLALAALVTLLAFLLFMPLWTPAKWAKFFANQEDQQRMLVTGSPEGTPFVRQYWDTGPLFHLRNLLLYTQGFALGLLGLLALFYYLLKPAWELYDKSLRTSEVPLKGVKKRKAAKGGNLWIERVHGALAPYGGPLLLISWILPYFAIVGLFAFAKFARYMLPITPFLALLAAAFLVHLLDHAGKAKGWLRLLFGATLLSCLGYGSGYFLTYFQPHPWIETSRWMLGGGVPQSVTENGKTRRGIIYNETWGDDLPVDVPGLGNAGNYDNRKVEIVEWDSPRKLSILVETLSQADAIVMADPRAYGTYLRQPERFPLTYAYFQTMMTSPESFGFKRAHEASNEMRFFGLKIDDSRNLDVPQWAWADESFTLYDRPHAYVFTRTTPMSAQDVQAALLKRVSDLGLSTLWEAGSYSPEELKRQSEEGNVGQAGAGETENPNIGLSRGALHPILHPVLTWWLLITLLGLIALPLARALFALFPDGGYALSRALGLFLFSWLAYNLAWLRVLPFYQSTLWLLLFLCALASYLWMRRDWAGWQQFFREKKSEILWSEGLFAAAFLCFVLFRSLNPNIHDIAGQGYFGGGEPLGMTYLNAVTRCATFPVYDPWLAPNNSSYYYFGYVMAAALTKLSGFAPAITYNLSLALYFSLSLLSAYGFSRALVKRKRFAFASGLAVACFGALSSIYVLVQKLSEPGQNPFSAWASHEMIWDPTRFPQLVNFHIFEFPFFSYLYGDLHPHSMVIGFGVLLCALLLLPFLSAEAGWKAFGGSPKSLALWVFVTALLLDAQYAINTWNWPVFLALSLGAMLVGPWVGKKLSLTASMLAGLTGFGLWLLMVGIPTKVYGLGELLMFGFRHYFIQDASRIGTVQPSEWQMVAYIPLAYFIFGLAGLGALTISRAAAWAKEKETALGAAKFFKHDFFEGLAKLFQKALDRWPLSLALLGLTLLVAALLGAGSLPGIYQGSVLCLSLCLALIFFSAFCMGGFKKGSESFLWLLATFTCLLVAGAERLFVADRMNTIFKFWMNGWVLMGLAFGVCFEPFFESELLKVKAKKKARRKAQELPVWLPEAGVAFAIFLGVFFSAWLDVTLNAKGFRNAPSYFSLAALLVIPGLWASFSPWRPKLLGRSTFLALIALGLVYPTGAILGRLHETGQYLHPQLDGMAFMRQMQQRGFAPDVKDYDLYDAALIDWLNTHADKTEVILEAPGTEMYKGFSRYSIYTGLPTLLGWDYQVGQQLGSRAGDQLTTRTQDADTIYQSPDLDTVKSLLRKYQVHWIVVGSIEHKQYPQADLSKFASFCNPVTQTAGSVLYRFDDVSATANAVSLSPSSQSAP